MKKLTTFLVAVFMTVALNAQEAKDTTNFNWNEVITAISKVESGGNPKAVSPSGKYVGYLQISKGMVTTCNNILGYKKFTFNDRYNKERSIEMFNLVQKHYNPENSIEKAIRFWNSGNPNCMKDKRPTNGYYKKVIAIYNTLAKK